MADTEWQHRDNRVEDGKVCFLQGSHFNCRIPMLVPCLINMSGHIEWGIPDHEGSTEQELVDLVATGDESTLFHLAGEERLPPSIYVALFDTGNAGVLGNLATGADVPRSVIEGIVARGGAAGELARVNDNASPETKDTASIGELSYRSLHLYLEERGATEAQRKHVLDAFEATGPGPGGPLLGEVWRAATARG